MPQPVIGVTMSMDDYGKIRPGTDYSFIRREYGEQVKTTGGQPVFLDPAIDPTVAARLCDGIIISGGEDINPALYGATITNRGGNLEPRSRTSWERELIDACDWAGVPILGICYGAQLLNIHYGGTLYQDLLTERPASLRHGHSGGAELHEVTFHHDFLGFSKGESAETAHRHHQAVHNLAAEFTVIASAPDGTIEAIAGRGHYGIQWHAESDGTASRIYGAFVKICTPYTTAYTLTNLLPDTAPETA